MSAMANRLPMMIVGRIIGVPTDIDNLVRRGYAATQMVEGLVSQDQLYAAGIAAMELRGLHHRSVSASRSRPAGQLAR